MHPRAVAFDGQDRGRGKDGLAGALFAVAVNPATAREKCGGPPGQGHGVSVARSRQGHGRDFQAAVNACRGVAAAGRGLFILVNNPAPQMRPGRRRKHLALPAQGQGKSGGRFHSGGLQGLVKGHMASMTTRCVQTTLQTLKLFFSRSSSVTGAMESTRAGERPASPKVAP